MHLALFDLDHTLLSCDSDHEWGQHLVEQGALDAVDYARRHAAYAAAYLAGTLDIEDFVRFQLAPLARPCPVTLASVRMHGTWQHGSAA